METSKTLKDIQYAEPGICRLDMKWPDGQKGFPTVVWLHSGDLTHGERHFVGISESIAQVAVDYRLLEAGKMTDGAVCIDDAAAAVAWTLDHIAEFGGDPGKVFLAGMSAGGYLTMMVGMAPRYLKAHGHDIRELAGLVPISGQATKHFSVRQFAGDTDPQFLPKIDELAPLHWCSKDIAPIVSVCGQEPWEWKCRSEENRLLIASCAALGHENAWFVSCPYADHGRALAAGIPYVEMLVQGILPRNLKVAE